MSTLALFFVSFALAGIVVQIIAVTCFGQYNSYVGHDGTVIVGAVICILAGIVAAVIFALVMITIHLVRPCRFEARSPLLLLASGAVYGLAMCLPGVIDAYVNGILDDARVDDVGMSYGMAIGYFCFFAGALLAPFILVRQRKPPLAKFA